MYVDDTILTSNDMHEMENLKQLMAKEFEAKNLGAWRYYLGIKVARSQRGIFISQRKHVIGLVKEIGMMGGKPSDTPIEPNHRLGTCVESQSVNKDWLES